MDGVYNKLRRNALSSVKIDPRLMYSGEPPIPEDKRKPNVIYKSYANNSWTLVPKRFPQIDQVTSELLGKPFP